MFAELILKGLVEEVGYEPTSESLKTWPGRGRSLHYELCHSSKLVNCW